MVLSELDSGIEHVLEVSDGNWGWGFKGEWEECGLGNIIWSSHSSQSSWNCDFDVDVESTDGTAEWLRLSRVRQPSWMFWNTTETETLNSKAVRPWLHSPTLTKRKTDRKPCCMLLHSSWCCCTLVNLPNILSFQSSSMIIESVKTEHVIWRLTLTQIGATLRFKQEHSWAAWRWDSSGTDLKSVKLWQASKATAKGSELLLNVYSLLRDQELLRRDSKTVRVRSILQNWRIQKKLWLTPSGVLLEFSALRFHDRIAWVAKKSKSADVMVLMWCLGVSTGTLLPLVDDISLQCSQAGNFEDRIGAIQRAEV